MVKFGGCSRVVPARTSESWFMIEFGGWSLLMSADVCGRSLTDVEVEL